MRGPGQFLPSPQAGSGQHRRLAAALLLLLATGSVVVVGGYHFGWAWTGLGTHKEPCKNCNLQPYKTLWDWLQLLIFPIVVAAAVAGFNWVQQRREQTAADERLQEAAVSTYVGVMKDLLLHENLSGSQEGTEVRRLAKTYTKAVLQQLDAQRKGFVMWFLSESNLLQAEIGKNSIFDLGGAQLSGVKMDGIDLHGANLSQANLDRAFMPWAMLERTNLNHATLRGADLRNANLRGANLDEANLGGADLWEAKVTDRNLRRATCEGAKMPDGRPFHGWEGETYETVEVKRQLQEEQEREEAATADGVVAVP
jgi:uncharacterized protein YjbI with pentapeptide repeats